MHYAKGWARVACAALPTRTHGRSNSGKEIRGTDLSSGLPIGKAEVWQGTLALMVLKTIEALGPLHGYGIARRIEQTSGDLLSLNYGTLYPALLKLDLSTSYKPLGPSIDPGEFGEWGKRIDIPLRKIWSG